MPEDAARRSGTAALRAAAGRLAVDRVTAEVAGALREAGIPTIVLKGPAVVHWLYEKDGARSYVDSDVLVAPGDLAPASEVLARLGFRKLLDETATADRRPFHAYTWQREGQPYRVDLHRTVVGVGVADELVWQALREHATLPALLEGAELELLDRPATALLVALQAAEHGVGEAAKQEDLRRAVECFDSDTWRAAAALADRLDAPAGLVAGLRLNPRGRAHAAELGLPEGRPFELALRSRTPPAGAAALYWLTSAPGLWHKLVLVRRLLFPSTALMRFLYPIAGRGFPGLAAAYAWRQVVIAARFVPAVRALRQTRRGS